MLKISVLCSIFFLKQVLIKYTISNLSLTCIGISEIIFSQQNQLLTLVSAVLHKIIKGPLRYLHFRIRDPLGISSIVLNKSNLLLLIPKKNLHTVSGIKIIQKSLFYLNVYLSNALQMSNEHKYNSTTFSKYNIRNLLEFRIFLIRVNQKMQ